MALINCRECGHKMSDRAESCPHCGCPQHIPEATPQLPENQQPEETYAAPAKKQGGLKWLWAVIPSFLVIAGAVYYFMFVYTPPAQAPTYLTSDYALNELKGKVKDARLYVETDTATFEIAYIQFDSNGRLSPEDSTLIRNSKGEIIKNKKEDKDMGTYYEEFEWKDGILNGAKDPWSSTQIKYNLDGTIKSITVYTLKNLPWNTAGDVTIQTYSDYKLDEHGNWISRTRQVEYIPKEGNGFKLDPVHVSRRITYYP